MREPGIWVSDWTCARHGAVQPWSAPHPPTQRWLADVARRSSVPVWVPWPLPAGWLFTGLSEVGTPRGTAQAVAVAVSGPNPAPRAGRPERPADLLLVAEQPGVGLGAHLAGLDGVDPGDGVGTGVAHASVRADGHVCGLWVVPSPADRAVYVGEAGGVWLYLVLWPSTAGVLLAEDLELADARSPRVAVVPPVGAPCPRL
ncbi:hypothetical protein GCM10027194_21790 [Thalassiella azotivora]